MSLSGESTEQRIAREGRERAEAERRSNEAAQEAGAIRMARMYSNTMPDWKLHGDASDSNSPPRMQAGHVIEIKQPGIYQKDDGNSTRIMLTSDGKIGFPDSNAFRTSAQAIKSYGDAIDFIKRGQGCDKIVINNPPGEPLDLKDITNILKAAKEARVAVRFDPALEARIDGFLANPKKSPQFGMTKRGDAKRLKIYNEIQALKSECNANHAADKPAKDNFLEMGKHQDNLKKTEKLPETQAGREAYVNSLLSNTAGALSPEEKVKAIDKALDDLDKRKTQLDSAHAFLENEVGQDQSKWNAKGMQHLADKAAVMRVNLMEDIRKEATDIADRRGLLQNAANQPDVRQAAEAQEAARVAAQQAQQAAPAQPAPAQPAQAQQAQAQQAQAQQAPAQPAQAQPAPVQAQPAQAQPNPAQAQPAQPAPAQAQPAQPAQPAAAPANPLLDRIAKNAEGAEKYTNLSELTRKVADAGVAMDDVRKGRGMTPGNT